MLQINGAYALVVAALLVICSADPRQDFEDNEGNHLAGPYSAGGQKAQDSGHASSSGLVREVRETQPYGLLSYLMSRRHDYSSPTNSGGSSIQEHWPSHRFTGYNGEGYLKRNFDEIDLSRLNTFVRKRNFDEIDQSWLPFPHKKRSYHYGSFLELPGSGFDKKRYKPEYPMDEIDLSSFPIGSKRSQHFLSH